MYVVGLGVLVSTNMAVVAYGTSWQWSYFIACMGSAKSYHLESKNQPGGYGDLTPINGLNKYLASL